MSATLMGIATHDKAKSPICLPRCLPWPVFAPIAEVPAAQAQLQKSSDLPPKADIAGRRLDVRFVPKADSCSAAINAALGQVLPDFR
jgi:hypothetical protein